MVSGSIERFVIDRLQNDDRYKLALSGAHDAGVHVDATVKAFVSDVAKCFEGLVSAFNDPALQDKLRAYYRKD